MFLCVCMFSLLLCTDKLRTYSRIPLIRAPTVVGASRLRVNPAHMGPDRCQVIKYSGLSYSTSIDLSSLQVSQLFLFHNNGTWLFQLS